MTSTKILRRVGVVVGSLALLPLGAGVASAQDNGQSVGTSAEGLDLSTKSPTTVPVTRRTPLLPTPKQPPGREPIRRSGIVESRKGAQPPNTQSDGRR